MRKRLLAIIATVAMVVAMMPSMVFAAGNTATVDTESELRAALNDATIDTIIIDGTIELGCNFEVTRTVTIKGGTITRNNDAAMKSRSLFDVTGTGVHLTLDGVTVDGRNIETSLWAIHVKDGASLTAKNSLITNNKSTQGPAAIRTTGAKDVTLINTTISNNESAGTIAGVYAYQMTGTFTLDKDSKIVNNKATGATAIHIHDSNAVIAGKIQNNVATADKGAGLYTFIAEGYTVTIKDTAEISGNKAALAGGGVYVNGAKDNTERGLVVMEGGKIFDNSVDTPVDATSDDLKDMGGDDLYVARGAMVIEGGTIGNANNKDTSIIVSNAGSGGGKLTVKGGTLNGKFLTPDTAEYAEVSVTGGTFSSDVSEYFDKTKLEQDANGNVVAIGSTKPVPENSPNTGDNMAPFAVAGLALAAMAAAVATRRKYN